MVLGCTAANCERAAALLAVKQKRTCEGPYSFRRPRLVEGWVDRRLACLSHQKGNERRDVGEVDKLLGRRALQRGAPPSAGAFAPQAQQIGVVLAVAGVGLAHNSLTLSAALFM